MTDKNGGPLTGEAPLMPGPLGVGTAHSIGAAHVVWTGSGDGLVWDDGCTYWPGVGYTPSPRHGHPIRCPTCHQTRRTRRP